PVPAERLAALRIGLAALLLLDVLGVYLRNARTFFGRDSLGRPEVFEWMYKPYWDWDAIADDAVSLRQDLAEGKPFHRALERCWRWSLLKDVEDPRIITTALLVWAAATALLLIGLGTRAAAVVV